MANQLTPVEIKQRGGSLLGRYRKFELWELKQYSNIDWRCLYLRDTSPGIFLKQTKRTWWLRMKKYSGQVSGRPAEMVPLRKKPTFLKWVRKVARENSDKFLIEADNKRKRIKKLDAKPKKIKEKIEITSGTINAELTGTKIIKNEDLYNSGGGG